jgi:outer membrane protein TolC
VLCQKIPPATCADSEKVVITPHDQLEASVSLEVPLVDVAGWSRVGAARATAKASATRAQGTAQDVERALAQRYFQAIAAHALMSAANQAVAAAEAAQKVAAAREGAGATGTLEVDRAAAEVARAQQSVADAELLRAVSRRAIESTSGLKPSDGAPAFADDLKAESALDTWESGAKTTPAVLAARLDVEAADKTRTVAWATLLPTVSATATERATNATGFSGKVGSYAIGLTATWRLDLVGIRGVAQQSAAADVSVARAEKTERDAKDKVFEAYQQVVAQIAKSKAARAQVKAASHAAGIAQDRYAEGAGTQLDVIQADRDAFQAEVARIQADADLAFARVSLRLAAGKPLDGVDAAKGGAVTAADAKQGTSTDDGKQATSTNDGKQGTSTDDGKQAISTDMGKQAISTAPAQGASADAGKGGTK